MDVFIGRQPIFDANLNVYGYELLYRSSWNNCYDGSDPNSATSQVIANTFFAFGADAILGEKHGFINFTRDLLIKDLPSVLPPDRVIIEILESIKEESRVVEACRRLKSRGYRLALDDFGESSDAAALLDLAEIIKVDFLASGWPERERFVRELRRAGVRLLAEKVESQEEFERAREMGYALFQGYFFARPVVVAGRNVPGLKLNYLRILREINRPEIEFGALGQILKRDLSLSYKLLRYVNSAAFSHRQKIQGIREALVLLGETEVRKWLSLVTLPMLATDKPHELLRSALARAMLCELFADLAGLRARRADLFLMGMFSYLDSMVGRPMDELLAELSLPDDIRDTMLGRSRGRLAQTYRLALAYHAADWETALPLLRTLGIASREAADRYLDAIQWADRAFIGVLG